MCRVPPARALRSSSASHLSCFSCSVHACRGDSSSRNSGGERSDEPEDGEVDDDTGDEERDGADRLTTPDAFTVLVDSRLGANLSNEVFTSGLGVRGVVGNRGDCGAFAKAAEDGTSMLVSVLRELRAGRGGAGPNSDSGRVLGERGGGEKLFTQPSVLNDGRVGEAERSCDDVSRRGVPDRLGGGRRDRGFSSTELVYGSVSTFGSDADRTGLRFDDTFGPTQLVSSRINSPGATI